MKLIKLIKLMNIILFINFINFINTLTIWVDSLHKNLNCIKIIIYLRKIKKILIIMMI